MGTRTSHKAAQREHRHKLLHSVVRSQDGKCFYCGRDTPWDEQVVDRTSLPSPEEPDHLSNLILACHPCNLEYGRGIALDAYLDGSSFQEETEERDPPENYLLEFEYDEVRLSARKIPALFADRRLTELEKQAKSLWPGSEDEIKNHRHWIVWRQFEQEVAWDDVEEVDADRDFPAATAEELVELSIFSLEPSLGTAVQGFGDHLRAELRRQGTSLEGLFAAQIDEQEMIPWDALERPQYGRSGLEKAEVQRKIRWKERASLREFGHFS